MIPWPNFSKDEPRFHPHNHNPREKGCTIDFRDRCKFLKPGERFRDQSGRLYRVAEDGSLRREDKENK